MMVAHTFHPYFLLIRMNRIKIRKIRNKRVDWMSRRLARRKTDELETKSNKYNGWCQRYRLASVIHAKHTC